MFHLSPQQARLRAGQLLEFGLADAAGQLARAYSGGMRRRLDLAASVIAAPPVMFLGSLVDVVARLDPMAAEVDDVALQRPSLEEAFTILTSAGPSEDTAQPELAAAGTR